VTASNAEEAITAAKAGADYLGLGTVFATLTFASLLSLHLAKTNHHTNSKANSKSIIGTAGLRSVLLSLAALNLPKPPKTVCIGGVNAANVQRILHAAASPHMNPQPLPLDGIAVVSALVAAPDPKAAAQHLLHVIHTPPSFAPHDPTHLISLPTDPSSLTTLIPTLLARLASTKPLCHNMTNLVVQNFAANVALALGGSPIMAGNGLEARDLAALGGSLVLNMGSASTDGIAQYTLALEAYNAAGGPVLFDPVGAGATEVRRSAVARLLGVGRFAVLKGNEAEVRTLWKVGAGPTSCTVLPDGTGEEDGEFVQHGVDSSRGAGLDGNAKAKLVKRLAQRERCVVVMSGATDYLSDGVRTFAVDNGVPLLGDITGSGCTLGTTIAAFAAVGRDDVLLAALAGVVTFGIAGERALKSGVKGPGTFVPAFLDALAEVRDLSAREDAAWIEAAKVKVVEV